MSSPDPNTMRFIQQVQAESQKVKLQEQIQLLADRCWDVCFTDARPPSKMDGKTQTCLSNCVNRMIDASTFMVEHLQMYSYLNGSGSLLALIEQFIWNSRFRRGNNARAGSAQLTQTRASRVFQEIISDVDKKQLEKVLDDAKVPLRRLSRTKRFQIPLCNGTNLLLLPPQGEIYIQQRGYRTTPLMAAANRGFRAKKAEPEIKESFLAKLANNGRKGPDAASYTYTTYKTEMEKLPEGQRNTFNEALIKGVLLAKESVGEGPKKDAWKTALRIVMWGVIIYVAITLFSGKNKMAGHIGNILMSSPEEVKPEDVTVGFDDVRGMDEAKCEVEEIVNYLKDPDRFSRLGGRLPKGVLMVGPPGTGKTLLARAIAGEAQVPFFHTSGSEFDELLVGQGARRVRDLFERAKQKAPCIIFIDEIDSVGAKRSSNSIHPYANQTINQLLSEMDGFNRNEGIIVIGATNRVEDLDKALLRPGRFDVRVTVMKPDLAGRKDIFNLYLDKITHDKSLIVDTLAKGSTGFTGADIENMVNQAALKAATEGCNRVYMRHLDEARDRILMGPARKQGRFPDEETNRNTAFHEAGHTLVAYFTKNATPLHKVTIIPRGPSMGHTSLLHEKDQYQVTRSQLMAQLDVLMGGRVAEELILGMENVTTGASDDLKRATQLATEMVKSYGMSPIVGLRDYTVKEESNYMVSVNERSPQTNETIDQEIKKLLDESYGRAKDLLTKYKKEHHALAEALLQYETLSADEIGLVIKGKKIPRLVTQPVIGEAMGRKQKRSEKLSGLVPIQLERGKLEEKP